MRLVCNVNAPRDKSSQFVGEKKGEINSPESRLVSYRKTGSFFPSLSLTAREKNMYAMRITTCSTRVDIHRDSAVPLPPLHTREEKKREIWETRGRKEERRRAGARQSEGPRQVRRRERVLLRSPIPAGRKRARCSVLRWSPSGQVAASLSLLRTAARTPWSSSIRFSSAAAVPPTVKRARASRLIAPN